LPSLNENFGNAAAEAVAATLPVLLTETCGIAPIIDGRAGMAVGLEVESLAEGIRQMMKSEVRSQMTARSEEVKRELSWEEPIRQQIEIYREAIARNTEKLKR
jgi:glycosyltransferase involved in cell wall biosynthesis